MHADILDQIVARRIERRAREGSAQGFPDIEILGYSDRRPLPFPDPLICEVKRRSPSRGDLATEGEFDPVAQARRYAETGPCTLSVLTEQDHFSGSLRDLMAIRRALPSTPILRKDFLIDTEDIRVSRMVGADAVLLIAAILSRNDLDTMLRETKRHGMTALVEVHDEEDLEKVRPLRPRVLGINSRDLRTFRVDILTPPALAARVDWPCILVFESGIFHEEDALVARDAGFSSLLVGEALMKDPSRASRLRAVMETVRPLQMGPTTAQGGAGVLSAGGVRRPFWSALATRRRREPSPRRPLVKICGITNRADAELARDLGADVLGLIYAPSPRTAPEGLAAELARDIGLPLVGVVVEGASALGDDKAGGAGSHAMGGEEAQRAPAMLSRARADLAAGHLAALQLHGEAEPQVALAIGWPYYKAIRPTVPTVARAAILGYRSPRVLVDAFDRERAGGTGKRVNETILEAVCDAIDERPQGALWLAGGLDPENVAEVIRRWRPELIDASSGLEAEPGKKDPDLMQCFFERIDRASEEE